MCRVFICAAGTSGEHIWATSEMPLAQKRGSWDAPGISLRNSGENAPETVEMLTPTFENRPAHDRNRPAAAPRPLPVLALETAGDPPLEACAGELALDR